ncbi:Protein TIC 56, chloroplastic [Vitis vinifera]|uniref:Protein TIC 56, chloroplastic n=1 Tax=Vitis vinifera TaxID=29760 RepID=A0A438GC46_VITVI|nr:Protein TIC 56, chloroplastic [Vitis vinifera]
MGSINFNPFGNWFQKPPNPIPPINLLSCNLLNTPKTLNFASISGSNTSKKTPKPEKPSDEPEKYKKMLEQFFWESETMPNYRHAPEVERILNEDPNFEKKENPTEEEIRENEKWWNEFRSSPVVQFLARAEEIATKMNEMELEENANPYWDEDRKLWQAVPHVPGLDGRPMPRKAIKTKKESDDKFWDFTRQFFFGLWGFRQRPYPPGRPIDVAQAIGYKRLEKRYYDFIMRSGGWYYKDRLGRTRGPLELITLKTAWGAGIIDKDTFIWGEDMDEWAPIHMVYGLEPAIATWEGLQRANFVFEALGRFPEWKKGALEAMADVVKGPLSMVLQDGSEVVFLENASSEEDTPSNKELSNFKDFSRFLGMSVEGYEEKIVLLLKKLKKMIGGGTLCKKRKKKAVSASRFERDLKRLDCMVSYGELVLANRRSSRNKWELILVD